MRIAISSKNFSGHTGSARIICAIARGFILQGNSVDIIGNTLNKNGIRDCGAAPVEIINFPFMKKLSREAYLKKHQRYLAKHCYDLCIGNGDEAGQDILVLHNCVNLRYELTHGTAVGDSAINNISAIHGGILKNRLFGRMIANSELMKRDISARYKLDRELIKVIYPAYDRNTFTPERRREAKAAFMEKMKIPQKAEFLVGLITSGDFAKRNIKGFFNTIKLLPDELAEKIHLVIVGKDKLDNFISEHPANLTHIMLSQDPASIMRSLDVMLYPALLEEFGLVVAETLACGTPVFSSRMVGATELFTGLHAAALCDKPDSSHFAACLAKFLSDAPYREALGLETTGILRTIKWDNYFQQFSQVADEVKHG